MIETCSLVNCAAKLSPRGIYNIIVLKLCLKTCQVTFT